MKYRVSLYNANKERLIQGTYTEKFADYIIASHNLTLSSFLGDEFRFSNDSGMNLYATPIS